MVFFDEWLPDLDLDDETEGDEAESETLEDGPAGEGADLEKAEDDDPCWDGYEAVGMKRKGGRKVPNCVPLGKTAYSIAGTLYMPAIVGDRVLLIKAARRRVSPGQMSLFDMGSGETLSPLPAIAPALKPKKQISQRKRAPKGGGYYKNQETGEVRFVKPGAFIPEDFDQSPVQTPTGTPGGLTVIQDDDSMADVPSVGEVKSDRVENESPEAKKAREKREFYKPIAYEIRRQRIAEDWLNHNPGFSAFTTTLESTDKEYQRLMDAGFESEADDPIEFSQAERLALQRYMDEGNDVPLEVLEQFKEFSDQHNLGQRLKDGDRRTINGKTYELIDGTWKEGDRPSIQEQMAEIPSSVLSNVQIQINSIKRWNGLVQRARETDALFQGGGRYTWEATGGKEPTFETEYAKLGKFRELAAQKGYDAEGILRELGLEEPLRLTDSEKEDELTSEPVAEDKGSGAISPRARAIASEILKGKFETDTKMLNRYLEEAREQGLPENEVWPIRGQYAKTAIDLLAEENLRNASTSVLEQQIKRHQRTVKDSDEAVYQRTKRGRTRGAGAGGFNRDLDRTRHPGLIAEGKINRIQAELDRRAFESETVAETSPVAEPEAVAIPVESMTQDSLNSLGDWVLDASARKGREMKYFNLIAEKAPFRLLGEGIGDSIHLQGIGSLPAAPARDIQPGDVLVWNSGGLGVVRSVTPSASGKTLTVEEDYATHAGKVETFTRKLVADRLVAALRYAEEGSQNTGRTKDDIELTQAEYIGKYAHRMSGTKNADRKLAARFRHRRLVMEALDAGKPVPNEVLKDYPELVERFSSR